MTELIEQMREHCDSKRHDVACKCYHLAEQEFLSRASKSDFWDKIHEVTELDFKGIHRIVISHIIHKILGIRFPAGLEDVAIFAEQNPELHIRVHLLYGESAITVWTGERTIHQKHFVDLCFSEFLNYSNHEIMGETKRAHKIFSIILF